MRKMKLFFFFIDHCTATTKFIFELSKGIIFWIYIYILRFTIYTTGDWYIRTTIIILASITNITTHTQPSQNI